MFVFRFYFITDVTNMLHYLFCNCLLFAELLIIYLACLGYRGLAATFYLCAILISFSINQSHVLKSAGNVSVARGRKRSVNSKKKNPTASNCPNLSVKQELRRITEVVIHDDGKCSLKANIVS